MVMVEEDTAVHLLKSENAGDFKEYKYSASGITEFTALSKLK